MKKRKIKGLKERLYLAAAGIAVVAIIAMVGITSSSPSKNDVDGDSSQNVATQTEDNNTEQQTTTQTADASASEDSADNTEDKTQEVAITEETQDSENTEEETVETMSSNNYTLHFASDSQLAWPVSGEVLMKYSMDATVYFATLDQYKYNPALIISGEVNEKIKAAAAGRVTDISSNEETGRTITMDIGDGYSLVYGQVKEEQVSVGDYVTAGTIIGYIAQPTKYYSEEGSNLYFKMMKDDSAVNPLDYLE